MLMYPCGRMLWRQSWAVSPFYVIFVVRRSVSKLVMQSLVVALVLTRLETRHSLDSRISRSLNCNRSSMLPFVWFSFRVSLITWRLFYMNYVGCPFLRGLITIWHCWFSSASMVWHRRISSVNSVVWLTLRVISGCARRWQRNSYYHEPVAKPLIVAAKVWNSVPSSSAFFKVFLLVGTWGQKGRFWQVIGLPIHITHKK